MISKQNLAARIRDLRERGIDVGSQRGVFAEFRIGVIGDLTAQVLLQLLNPVALFLDQFWAASSQFDLIGNQLSVLKQ